MTSPVIGFIGLGLMGGNMVQNLQKKGFAPIVMDLNKEAVAEVVARGGSEATSAAELAASSDIIMLCLTTSTVVEKVVYGEDGILAGIKEGAVGNRFWNIHSLHQPARSARIWLKKGLAWLTPHSAARPLTPAIGLLNIMGAGRY